MEEKDFVKIPKTHLEKLLESLGKMIGYADDGNLRRDDEDFSDFFKEVDNANKILDETYERYF